MTKMTSQGYQIEESFQIKLIKKYVISYTEIYMKKMEVQKLPPECSTNSN